LIHHSTAKTDAEVRRGPILISCLGVDSDLALLPHFLAHYQALGIAPGAVHVILNAPGEDHAGVDEACATLARFGHAPAEIWTDRYSSAAMWERRRAVQARVARPGDWIVNADVDELHEYPAPLPEVIAWCEARGITALQGPFIDRIAPDGGLAPVRETPALSDQFPVRAEAMIHIAGLGGGHDAYGTVKLMLHRAEVRPSRGGHHPQADPRRVRYALHRPLAEFPGITRPGFRFAHPFRVHHFKWSDALVAGLRRRLANPDVSPAGKAYGTKLLAHFETRGGFDLSALPRTEPRSRPPLPWRLHMAALRRGAQMRGKAARIRRRLRTISP